MAHCGPHMQIKIGPEPLPNVIYGSETPDRAIRQTMLPENALRLEHSDRLFFDVARNSSAVKATLGSGEKLELARNRAVFRKRDRQFNKVFNLFFNYFSLKIFYRHFNKIICFRYGF